MASTRGGRSLRYEVDVLYLAVNLAKSFVDVGGAIPFPILFPMEMIVKVKEVFPV